MANSIALFQAYVPILDEVYANASHTAKLDSNQQLVSFDGKEFKIPKMSLQGLATHDRNGSYVDGDVTLTFQTKTPDYDRNRKFSVDAMDNAETAGITFGMLSGEFIRTKVVPEIDAVRFAKYYANAGTKPAGADLTTGAAVKTALRAAMDVMTNGEVPLEDRHLFITSTLLNLVKDLANTESKEILAEFASITVVPATRFYSAVTLYDGVTSGQEAGGYIKNASTGKNINFLIIHRPAVIQSLKHVAPKYIPAELNQSGDKDIFAYRVYGVNEFFENKVKGIYGHIATT